MAVDEPCTEEDVCQWNAHSRQTDGPRAHDGVPGSGTPHAGHEAGHIEAGGERAARPAVALGQHRKPDHDL
jgi:hypothetical protein